MPVNWTAENDRKLLLNLISTLSTKDVDAEALASLFLGATPKAILERIAKLRRELKAANAIPTTTTPTMTTPTTTAPTRPQQLVRGGAVKKGRGRVKSAGDGDEDGEVKADVEGAGGGKRKRAAEGDDGEGKKRGRGRGGGV